MIFAASTDTNMLPENFLWALISSSKGIRFMKEGKPSFLRQGREEYK